MAFNKLSCYFAILIKVDQQHAGKRNELFLTPILLFDYDKNNNNTKNVYFVSPWVMLISQNTHVITAHPQISITPDDAITLTPLYTSVKTDRRRYSLMGKIFFEKNNNTGGTRKTTKKGVVFWGSNKVISARLHFP